MKTIDFDTYGRLLAHLLGRRAPVAEILADLHVDGADLLRDEPELRRELAEAWPNRRGISAMRFATALVKELSVLQFPLIGSPSNAEPPSTSKPEVAVPSFLQPAPLPASPPLPAPAASPPTAPSLPPVIRAPAHLVTTGEADLSAILAGIRGGALPFAATPAAPPPPASSAPAGPASPPPPPAPPAPPAAPRALASSAPTTALPAVSLDLDRYPLELYAAVTGALARGEPRADVLAAQQLAPETFDALARAWSARFADDPALRERFTELARSAAQTPRKDTP